MWDLFFNCQVVGIVYQSACSCNSIIFLPNVWLCLSVKPILLFTCQSMFLFILLSQQYVFIYQTSTVCLFAKSLYSFIFQTCMLLFIWSHWCVYICQASTTAKSVCLFICQTVCYQLKSRSLPRFFETLDHVIWFEVWEMLIFIWCSPISDEVVGMVVSYLFIELYPFHLFIC